MFLAVAAGSCPKLAADFSARFVNPREAWYNLGVIALPSPHLCGDDAYWES
jgi:hypothetical protein